MKEFGSLEFCTMVPSVAVAGLSRSNRGEIQDDYLKGQCGFTDCLK